MLRLLMHLKEIYFSFLNSLFYFKEWFNSSPFLCTLRYTHVQGKPCQGTQMILNRRKLDIKGTSRVSKEQNKSDQKKEYKV